MKISEMTPYKSNYVSGRDRYWAANGSNVHIICDSESHAHKIVAALNAAYQSGMSDFLLQTTSFLPSSDLYK